MKGWDAKDWIQVAGVCIFSLFVLFAIISSASAAVAPEVVEDNRPFDHSDCQYPDRTTNPPDGCDNSDPCDPATVKGGSGECTTPEAPPSPVIPTSQNEVTEDFYTGKS